MARRFTHRSQRPAARSTLWLFIGPVTGTMTATGGTIFTSLNADALALRPFTIIRTHMHFNLGSDQAATPEFGACAWGAEVVSDQSLAVGVTAVPTPDTDAGSDFWFAHRYMTNFFATAIGRRATSYDLDSKAMRKVDEGQDLITVGELESSTSQGGVSLFAAGRILIKVH